MNQPKTDFGSRHESGEREPKRATASDTSGEKSVGTKNGVAMGKADKVGSQEGAAGRPHMGGIERGEFNTGRSEDECYSHKRMTHAQD